MAFEMTEVNYSGKILEVNLQGRGGSAVVGGETSYPFHLFEGAAPHKPLLAMEVWDMKPDSWPEACSGPVSDVWSDPAAWAKKCVDEFGADLIVVQLKSIDPNGEDAPPEAAAEVVGKVWDAVEVPVVVWGSANVAKDSEVLKHVAEVHQDKTLILGPVEEANHKAIGAACLAYGHSILASSPIDVNLAKQLNILLTNLGIPMERIFIDPTTGGLGYGLEYSYSVMERIRMAALVQEDDKLVLPMINNVGNEVWKCKEANQTLEDAPDLGDPEKRGVLMESTAAVSYLMAGSDILVLRHPESVKRVRKFVDGMLAERAPAAERVAVDRPKAEAVAGAAPSAKAAAPAPAPAAAKKAVPPPPGAKKKAAPPPPPGGKKKPPPPPGFKQPKDKKLPPPPPKVAAAKPVDDAKLKAEAEAAAKIAAENAAKAQAEAAEKAAAEAKAKAEAEAKAKADAEAKAREAKKAKEADDLAALRAKRREERMKHLKEQEARAKAMAEGAEGVEYGEDRPEGVAGKDAEYILKNLDRWRSRGSGVLGRMI